MQSQQNYFQLLGLNQSFQIDQQKLADNYRQLQRQFHPDKFASASDMERRLSVQKSALINEAYLALKSPLNRASYMLKLRGKDLSNDTSTAMAPEFLMQQMHLREELEEIRHSSDPVTRLHEVSEEINEILKDQIGTLSKYFSIKDSDLEKIADYVRRMQFIVKLQQEVELLEEDLS